MTPPDTQRCQARKPGPGPFSLGWGPGGPGDPKDGYRARCTETPSVIVVERVAGDDGHRGSMSLCDECLVVLHEQEPEVAAGVDEYLVVKWVEAQRMLVEADCDQCDGTGSYPRPTRQVCSKCGGSGKA